MMITLNSYMSLFLIADDMCGSRLKATEHLQEFSMIPDQASCSIYIHNYESVILRLVIRISHSSIANNATLCSGKSQSKMAVHFMHGPLFVRRDFEMKIGRSETFKLISPVVLLQTPHANRQCLIFTTEYRAIGKFHLCFENRSRATLFRAFMFRRQNYFSFSKTKRIRNDANHTERVRSLWFKSHLFSYEWIKHAASTYLSIVVHFIQLKIVGSVCSFPMTYIDLSSIISTEF